MSLLNWSEPVAETQVKHLTVWSNTVNFNGFLWLLRRFYSLYRDLSSGPTHLLRQTKTKTWTFMSAALSHVITDAAQAAAAGWRITAKRLHRLPSQIVESVLSLWVSTQVKYTCLDKNLWFIFPRSSL